MASHKESGDRVLLTCSCFALSPVTRLYFCRHCIKLRCPLCVSHEVDSYYCPNCLENMPSAEAKLKKNRCANCFDCPSCGNTLSTRATAIAVQSASPGDLSKATQAKKVYYLACGFCRWSSRDVGIEDKSVASGGWQDKEHKSTKRVSTLVEFYRQLAQKEKMEREKKKLTRRRSYMHLAITSKSRKDKFGLSSLTRRKSSLSYLTASLNTNQRELSDEEIVLKDPNEANEEVDILPEEFYTKPLVLEKVPLLSQRLAQPDFQPETIQDLYPRHKHLLAKRSQRCRECEHNLCKPEFNPSSIKFKIQLGAVYYVPRLRIAKVSDLKFDKECTITLSFTNPVENVLKISLLPFVEGTENSEERGGKVDEESAKERSEKGASETTVKLEKNNDNKATTVKTEPEEKNENDAVVKSEKTDDTKEEAEKKEVKTEGDKETKIKSEKGVKSGKEKASRTNSLFEKKPGRAVNNRCDSRAFKPTAEVILPTFPLVLAARDDAAEFDEGDVSSEMFNDDPRVVTDRQANKLWFVIKVIPKKAFGDVKFSMIVQYDYKHTSTALVRAGDQEPEDQVVTLRHKVHINAGSIDGATQV